MQTVIAQAPADFFKPDFGGGDNYFESTTYLRSTIFVTYSDGVILQAKFQFDPNTGYLSCNFPPHTGPAGSLMLISKSVSSFGTPYLTDGGQIACQLPDRFPAFIVGTREVLDMPYSYEQASALAVSLLNSVALLNPARVFPYPFPTGPQGFQLGYPTDVIVAGSQVVSGQILVSPTNIVPAGAGMAAYLPDNTTQAASYSNQHSPVCIQLHDSSGNPTGPWKLSPVAYAYLTKSAVFSRTAFGEQLLVDGNVPGIIASRPIGEYIYTPSGIGETYSMLVNGQTVTSPKGQTLFVSWPDNSRSQPGLASPP